jgi:hypothetical protein
MLQHKRFQQDKEISTCLFVPNALSTIYHFYHGYCKLILLTLFLPFSGYCGWFPSMPLML